MTKNFYVIAVISNPVRYKSRYALYKKFIAEMEIAGAKVLTVEIAFGDRPFEVTERDNPWHLQLKSYDELWHKENMINLGIQYLSQLAPNWEYVSWCDADLSFIRKDWMEETVHKLQHHMFLQMWEHAIDLGPNGETIHVHNSFMSQYHKYGSASCPDRVLGYYSKWHPGYCWAARREALDLVGGVIDIGILGSGDRHMAGALIGQVQHTYNSEVHPNYKKILANWQEQAERYIRRDVGFLPGTIVHFFHGKKKDRQYSSRWKVLVDNKYNPITDIKRDSQGVFQLVDHGDIRSMQFRDDLRRYFSARNEDSIDLE